MRRCNCLLIPINSSLGASISLRVILNKFFSIGLRASICVRVRSGLLVRLWASIYFSVRLIIVGGFHQPFRSIEEGDPNYRLRSKMIAWVAHSWRIFNNLLSVIFAITSGSSGGFKINARQVGQRKERLNLMSRHSSWKKWPHLYSFRMVSPFLISWLQIFKDILGTLCRLESCGSHPLSKLWASGKDRAETFFLLVGDILWELRSNEEILADRGLQLRLEQERTAFSRVSGQRSISSIGMRAVN